MSKETPIYGGQALLEGVMFTGKDHMVTAVRRNDDSIEYYYVKKEKKPIYQKLKKILIPFQKNNFHIEDLHRLNLIKTYQILSIKYKQPVPPSSD
mgnify:CR=1 FL=1